MAKVDLQAPMARSAVDAFFGEVTGMREAPTLRAPWAQLDWFREASTWAESELRRLGRVPMGPAEQVRQWSISSVIRLPSTKGDGWFKAVPSFFAHEGALMRVLCQSPPEVPLVLATEDRRGWTLMEALSEAKVVDTATMADALRMLARLQTAWIGRTDELLAVGCPDRRLHSLHGEVRTLMQRDELRAGLDDSLLARLDAAVEELPERCTALAQCGVPETLVHGDFHVGNVMASDGRLILADWTDGCVGHPFFDLATALPGDGVARTTLLGAYMEGWREIIPTDDLARAFSLSDALACLHHAVSYQRIVDSIEADTRWGLGGAVERWLERFLNKVDAADE